MKTVANKGMVLFRAGLHMLKQAKQWRGFVLLLCLLVFLLALNAKISVYHQGAGSADSIASSKLWLNGQKMELRSDLRFVPVLWIVALLFCPPLLCHKIIKTTAEFPVWIPTVLRQYAKYQFLRPPPTF